MKKVGMSRKCFRDRKVIDQTNAAGQIKKAERSVNVAGMGKSSTKQMWRDK
jgi:hypothetical protein